MPLHHKPFIILSLIWLFVFLECMSAQDKNLDAFASLPTTSWPTYNGDFTGQRHSPLTQITPRNANQMGLAWAFQTGQSPQIKSTPILLNGVVYVSTPDNVWALDARSGRQLWHYIHPANNGFHIGSRGVAVYKNSVFFTTPDDHVVSLDVNSGNVRWEKVIADYKRGYWMSVAPLVVGNHLLVATSGDFDNLVGKLVSLDPEDGSTQWTYSASPAPPGAEGTPTGYTGGEMWMSGTYDPQLNLVYVGTGNPTPVLNGAIRPGDNPWTCSIVALNPDTGKLVWAFQPSPHDTHDWDAVEIPVLVDGEFNGVPRKMLMQASRNGYFFVLDRTNGKNLLTAPFVETNWSKGVDEDGRPIPNPEKEPAQDGRLVAPNESGGTNFRSPSFDRKLGLFLVSAQEGYGIYFFKPEYGSYGWAGADYNVFGRAVIKAIDYKTGKIRWTHEVGGGTPRAAGILTTDSGVTFTGDTVGNALALRTSDGATLWHSRIGLIGNSPITYELDGKQLVLIAGDSALYAFALPDGAASSQMGTHTASSGRSIRHVRGQ